MRRRTGAVSLSEALEEAAAGPNGRFSGAQKARAAGAKPAVALASADDAVRTARLFLEDGRDQRPAGKRGEGVLR